MALSRESFQRALETLDVNFNVRWGSYVGEWVVERKAGSYIHPDEIFYLKRRLARLHKLCNEGSDAKRAKLLQTWKGIGEDLTSAERGYRVIVIVPQLTQQVYDMICMSDMQRYGGYARIADELDAAEARKEEEIERHQADQRQIINREVFDILNFLWRRKDTKLAHGEKNLNYLLHGRHSDKPVLQL